MKNFSTWILVIFMAMFWLFRMVVAFTHEVGENLGGIEPLNQTMEIVLLFIVLVCILLIIKRKIIGALIYLLAYGMYFGNDLVNRITMLTIETREIATSNNDIMLYLNMFISLIGIALPVAVLFDLLLDANRKVNAKDGKTDWFYKNEQFDRQFDERDDKNNYRTM